MKKIAFIPLDNRPVCYDLPSGIIDCSGDFELILPPIESVGALFSVADYEKIIDWFANIGHVDYVICALDTIAYGSLVASRRCNLSFNEIKNRLDKFKTILIKKNAVVYAFSSIMRISNNNYNEEEKSYWNRYGKKIFDYSFNYHKSLVMKDSNANDKFSCISNVIPNEILDDYIGTRERNFGINKLYLDWLQDGVFDMLVFSKDDCAQFGFNVLEAQELEKIIIDRNLNAFVKTGADEIPLSLLSRVMCCSKNVKIFPLYTSPDSNDLISKYEDISLEKCVCAQIELAGCSVSSSLENADLIMYVNNFESEQGELVMNIDTSHFMGDVPKFDKPVFVCDVRFANGADNCFVNALLNNNFVNSNFFGYSGWNTSANTIGSAICAALVKYCSDKFYGDKFDKLQTIRFLDDWAYQANVRKEIRDDTCNLTNNIIYDKINIFKQKICKVFKLNNVKFEYSYPWNRFFEIRIKIYSIS